MTKRASLGVVAVVALAMVAGCKKEEVPAPKPPPPANPPAAPAASVQDAAKNAQAQGQAAVDSAATQGQAAAGDMTAMASQKLDQAVQYIKDNKVDMADKIVSDLEANKASLPAALQQRLADVRKMVDTAKAAKSSGLSVPKL